MRNILNVCVVCVLRNTSQSSPSRRRAILSQCYLNLSFHPFSRSLRQLVRFVKLAITM